MPAHIEPNPHLTKLPSDDAVARTFLGQAHLAGTGPAGKTCRECSWWFRTKLTGEVKPHQYHGRSSQVIGKHMCNKPILNKAYQLVPHDAGACRFFDERELPPTATRERTRK